MLNVTRLSLLIVVVATACHEPEATPRSAAMPTDRASANKETVRRLFAVYVNERQDALLPELIAEEFVGVTGVKGPAGFAVIIDALRGGFPDIRYTVEDLVAEGDLVVARWTWTGTHAGQFRAYAASGRTVTNEGMAVFRMRDGRIVGASTLTDRLGFLQGVGVIPPEVGR